MAETVGPIGTSEQPADVGGITDLVLSHIAQQLSADTITTAIANGVVTAFNAFMDGLVKAANPIGKAGGAVLVKLEEPVLPLFGGFVTPILSGLFDSGVDDNAFKDRANSGTRNDAAASLVNAFMDAIERDAPAPSEPSMEGSRRLATVAVHAAIEGWFNAFIGENLAEAIPWDWLRLKELTKLPDEVINALGIGRLVRSALLPLVTATAVEPMRWAANKKYRPTKLGVSTIARQLARGRWTPDQAHEELAREGYTDERIDAILNEVAKAFSAADVDLLIRAANWSRDQAIQELRNGGWDELQAPDLLDIERHKRHEAMENEIARAAVTAYADGRIDKLAFDKILPNDTLDADRLLDLQNLAILTRELRQVHLSPAEAEACVLGGIIPLSEYRGALERVGYVPDAVDALEMLLRLKLDKTTTAAAAKQQTAAEKAAAAKTKADTAAAKKAAAEAAAALKRQGSPAELSHAVVRGLIPITRLEQVLAQTLDADTVAIYVADVELQRQTYLDQQAKAADAAKRAAAKGLTVGDLSTALVDGVLTVDQVRQQLTDKGLDPADVAVLLATMQQRATDHAAAVKAHDQALARATNKPVPLPKAEALVLAGHWTFAQYNALLASLAFSEATIADLDLLLQDRVAKNQAAAAIRAGIGQASPTKGLSLAEARSAVLLGTWTVDQFQSYLVSAGYTADAIGVLIAELRDAVVAADAARARRAATPLPSDGRAVALADVTKAARLGVITPAAYQAELVSRGYSADDIALELDLLTTEIATTRAAQRLQPTTPGAAPAKALSLADTAKAVKAGQLTIDDYRTLAVQLGYSAADVQTLTNVLTDEVNTLAFASARHTTIAGALTLKGVDIAPIEAAVTAGTSTLDDYEQWILAQGYGAADAGLLRALLASHL
jgi:hypothetical protein